jgi:hypothetical protein
MDSLLKAFVVVIVGCLTVQVVAATVKDVKSDLTNLKK